MSIKVIHMPVLICNSANVLSEYLKKKNIESSVISYFRTWLNYEGDYNLELDNLSINERNEKLRKFVDDFFNYEAKKYDVFHYHFFETLSHGMTFGSWNAFPEREPYWELKLLKKMGKKIVVSSWGSDVRNASKIVYYLTKFDNKDLQLPYPPLNTYNQYFNIWNFSKYADVIVHGDSEAIKHTPYGISIPIALDTKEIDQLDEFQYDKEFSILHAPSNNFIKGSKHVLAVFEKLEKKYGDKINLKYIRNLNHKDALKAYKGKGLAIDELNFSYMATFALECMYMGRAVVECPRREEFFDDDPKINAPIIPVYSQEELFEKLCEAYENQEKYTNPLKIKEMKNFVVENFSASVIAEYYSFLYEKVINNEKIVGFQNPEWLVEFDKLIFRKKVDENNYYSAITDYMLKTQDYEKLFFECNQGRKLANDIELLAKMVIGYEMLQNENAVESLKKSNIQVIETKEFKDFYDKSKTMLNEKI